MAAKNGNFYSHQSLDGLTITAQFLSESVYMKEQAFQSFTVDTQGLLWILPDSCQAKFWQHLVHQSVPSIPFVMNSSHLGGKCACLYGVHRTHQNSSSFMWHQQILKNAL